MATPSRPFVAALLVLSFGCARAPVIAPTPTRVSAVQAPDEQPTCTPSRLLHLDLASWLEGLQGVTTLRDANALLAKARFTPMSTTTEGMAASELTVATQVLDVALQPGGARQDRVVSVLFDVCESSEACWYHQRFLVLRSVDSDLWCQLDHALDLVQETTDQACLLGPAGEQEEPRRVTALRLIDEDVDSLVVSSQHGYCDGIGRSAEWTLGYYHVMNERLEELFQREVYTASYASPIPPTREELTIITPTGPFPRELDVLHEVQCPDHRDMCSDPEPDACDEDTRFHDPACEPLEERSRYRFEGGAYVPVRLPSD